MPIVLIQEVSPDTPGTTSYGVKPKTTLVENVPNHAKTQAIAVRQGQAAIIEWIMKDAAGCTANLTTYTNSEDYTFTARVCEALSFGKGETPVTLEVAVRQANLGTVTVGLSTDVVAYPGISIIEVGVLTVNGVLVFSDRFYLFVERGLFGAATSKGPPTLDEIRLRLRDSSAVDNYLLTTTEFDTAEICDAIVHAVQAWNDAQPPTQDYNTSNFPFQSLLFLGIAAQLHYTTARYYLREHVEYSAEGVAFVDKKKYAEYAQAGGRLWAEFLKGVKAKKVGVNLKAFGYVSSDYPH